MFRPARCPGDTPLTADQHRERAPEEVERLFDDHYERLVRALTLAAGSREVARDAVQEAFVEAHLRWARIGSYDDPVAWVRRVAVNRILNHHRSLRRRVSALVRLGRPGTTDPATDAVELRPDLTRALATLTERQRMAVALHHIEGLSVADVAALLGVTEGTVKTHLSRGRAALRAHLEVS